MTFYPPSDAAYRARNKVLTERELQVLCMAAVMSDKAVAKALNIRNCTVRRHNDVIRHKTGASSTREAAFILLDKGVIDVTDITRHLKACNELREVSDRHSRGAAQTCRESGLPSF